MNFHKLCMKETISFRIKTIWRNDLFGMKSFFILLNNTLEYRPVPDGTASDACQSRGYIEVMANLSCFAVITTRCPWLFGQDQDHEGPQSF